MRTRMCIEVRDSDSSLENLRERERERNSLSNKPMSRLIYLSQLTLEDAIYNIAKSTKKPSVIVCDRGCMDSMVYLSKKLWSLMLGISTIVARLIEHRRKRLGCNANEGSSLRLYYPLSDYCTR